MIKQDLANEHSFLEFDGQCIDDIYKKDKNDNEYLYETKIQDIKIKIFTQNLVVNSVRSLLAGLLANESSFTGGILYHALGHGDSSWDTSVPDPNSGDTSLYDEHFRKTPDSITYLDGSNNVVPWSISVSKIEITTTFDYTDSGANGSIREQGLFGGNATVTLDSGVMVNALRHVEIYKDATIKIVRRIRIQL